MIQMRRIVLVVVCAILSTMLMQPSVAAASHNQNPRAVDPNRHQSRYQTLAAEWWQWAFRTPNSLGGPFRAGTVDCAANQSHRNVLFLAGPFSESSPVDRTCARPIGRNTQIFVPVINTECSDIEEPPFFGATPKKRRACVNASEFNPANLSAEVDGRRFPVAEAMFNIVSKDFVFTAATGNPFGLNGSGHSTTRGVWLLLKPLHHGNHTITFTGSYPASDFSLSVIYHLTVK